MYGHVARCWTVRFICARNPIRYPRTYLLQALVVLTLAAVGGIRTTGPARRGGRRWQPAHLLMMTTTMPPDLRDDRMRACTPARLAHLTPFARWCVRAHTHQSATGSSHDPS